MVYKKTIERLNMRKFIFVLIFSLMIYVLNGGVVGDSVVKMQSLFLVGVFVLSVFFSRIRLIFFNLALIFILAMVGFYILSGPDNLGLASLFGSSGFGIIVLLLLVYIPELVRKGYITDLKRWPRFS